MSRSPILTSLALGAVGLTVLLGVLRVSGIGGSTASPEAMLPFLIALAAMCVVGLTFRQHATTAWLALIVALGATTLGLAAVGREVRGSVDPATWRWLSVTIALSAIVSTGAAVAYAADPVRRIARWVPAVGVAAVAAVFAVAVWALATADPDAAVSAGSLGDLGLVTRIFLATAVAFVACGVLGDLRPAVARTGVRMALEARRSLGVGGTVMYAGRWGRTFADELRPGRTHALEAARAERARIARDLHAVVVPDLRRAIREAEAGGSVEHLAGSLRDALREVEAMMETRDVVGLEVGGLVPALESLAERVEDRSDVRVAIDVADDGSQDFGLPPVRVAAAALRVAALALENVMRHAPSARVRLLVASGPERVRVTIEDDGPGVRPDAASSALEEGRRGLADMVTEASLCGASLRSSRGEAGTGTIVAFDWPAG